jgi:hypothetical protein
MGEQEEEEGAEHAPCGVEGQRSGDFVSYLHPLETARQKVQNPIAQGGVETQGLQLNDELEGYYGVECLAVVDEQHSCIGIPLVLVG